MIVARASSSVIPALFAWREQAEIGRLQAQREELIARIGKMRPHSHRRIELQARLRQITATQLELAARLESGR